MRIVLCGSMSAATAMRSIANTLIADGHEVVLPDGIEMHLNRTEKRESSKEKADRDVFRSYFEKMKTADAILVVNEEKNGMKDYIGPNTLIEIAFAHVLEKRLFVLYGIPSGAFSDELLALKPIALHGDLQKIIKV